MLDIFFKYAYTINIKANLQDEIPMLYMAQAVNVNFKLDADVKKSMEQVCSELGLSMSAAFTIFAKKVGREKRIPFEVSVDPFYSESNIRYLENIVHDIKNGRANFAEHELIEVE